MPCSVVISLLAREQRNNFNYFIVAIVIVFRNLYHSSTYYSAYLVINAGFQHYLV